MKFKIDAKDKDSSARAGIITTSRGVIETPVFMPVGTVGSVKGVTADDLKNNIDAPIILGNTYHLYLRPGLEVLKEAGGLHKFIGWDRFILTDSGGYQVFSLTEKRKLSEEGAMFSSHIDGSKHLFSPENVVDTQRIIGSDIMMAFDECPPYPSEYIYAKKSMELTHRWLERGHRHFSSTEPLYGTEQAFFPIVQGSTFSDLRRQSAEFIASQNCSGNAIGGLSVGEPADMMYEMVDLVNQYLPLDKPRYLMGVGTPANILESIALGVDMFDCVMPTRNGRNGMIFTSEGIVNIRNKKWQKDFSPIDPTGTTIYGMQYSKAYLRHLVVAGEMLGPIIASVHNLAFYLWLVKEARTKIISGEYLTWKNHMVKKLTNRL